MNASSESGLCATLISRSWPDALISLAFVVSKTAVIYTFSGLGPLRLKPHSNPCASPAACDSCGQHHFEDFSGDEPVQPQVCGFGQRMREQVQPAQASGEEE